MIRAVIEPAFESFRARARELLDHDIPPADVTWDDGTGQTSLFADPRAPTKKKTAVRSVPRRFLSRAETVALHSDPDRWSLLYRLAWRLTHGEPELLDIAGDPDVARFRALAYAVDHDEHRAHAFVRFRRVMHDGDETFIAWYEADHDVLPRAAEHFVDRYPNMRWAILSPDDR